jgi:methylenetetrahydrofolate reductase (NADPH)
MKSHIDKRVFHVEVLTPKQASETLDDDLQKFAEKYTKVIESGAMACITDNPMGNLSFQATEVLPELGLDVKPEQLMLHLNTFHTRQQLDEILNKAAEIGIKYILAISGDGSERLPKLSAESIGMSVNTITSVELMQFINKAYPGVFTFGVAFNPYEPQDHEIEKMHRKIEAGAQFIITQPVLGRDERVMAVKKLGLPVVVEAWMSKKLSLLSKCVGYDIPEGTPYDPMANLKELVQIYPDCGFYLALLGVKTQLPFVRDIWK